MNYKALFCAVVLAWNAPLMAQKKERSGKGDYKADVEVTVVLDKEKIEPNQKVQLTLGISKPNGSKALLETNRDKFMHLYVISEDLSEYQHLYPQLEKDGNFKVEIEFPKAGNYQLFCDFKVAGIGHRVVPVDMKVEGKSSPSTVETSQSTRMVDGYEVSLKPNGEYYANEDLELVFSIKKNGKPVKELDTYQGAEGQLVGTPEGAATLRVAHPKESVEAHEARFTTRFNKVGLHKMWFEFMHERQVRTVEFTVQAKRRPKPPVQEVIKSQSPQSPDH